ncbi:Crp/Fnr family transcriptional regulator [Thermithiobacillus plumbiphilus]|uniref:Crp/Fnr family transcriptional regulator n=1 Tax=Thermithiobacillus plumbiphilus TaxID=1729899 RepID=A0ABU9DB78_9PROT
MLKDIDLQLLRKAPLFSSLGPQELGQLLDSASALSLQAGEQLFAEGEPAQAFYVVIEGSMRLYKLSAEGNEKVIELIQAGETFAEAVVFLGGRYPVHAAALSPARLIRIDNTEFVRALRSNNNLAMKMLASISMRLHQLVNDVRALSLESAGQRVAGYLLELAGEAGAGSEVLLPAQKHVIASRLGIKPETFSRVLTGLREQNLIDLEGQHIRLPDAAALRRWRDNHR